MHVSKIVVKTSNNVKTYENVRVVKSGTDEDLFGKLIENLRPEFEIICQDNQRVRIEFNDVTEIVL